MSDHTLNRTTGNDTFEISEENLLREQDRYLPIANVSKIMKKDLPIYSKVSKEAKECVQECASEFIGFITSEAAEWCQKDRRKTINGDDILFSLKQLGFDNYSVVLREFLEKYRDASKFELGMVNITGSMTNSGDTRPEYAAAPSNTDEMPVADIVDLLPMTDLASTDIEKLLGYPDIREILLSKLKANRKVETH